MMNITVHLADCMDIMKTYPDGWFDLCVCDPPYGISRSNNFGAKEFHWKQYRRSDWDNASPNKSYFDELFRISKNQVIWGGNYFVQYLKPSMGWIFWDKGQDLSMSDGELAFTSFNQALRRVYINRAQLAKEGGGIHPTQKPIKLYDWTFKKYLPHGGKVIDTHGGSMSSVIPAGKAGNIEMVCSEIDEDYFNDAEKRIKTYFDQGNLFQNKPDITFVR